LYRDFIDYRQKTCYRRNEVWIRRGAISDLATPEEIVRLARGEPLRESEEDKLRAEARQRFSHLSQNERRKTVSGATSRILQGLAYGQIPREHWPKLLTWANGGSYGEVETRCKRLQTTVVTAYVLRCAPTLTVKMPERLTWHDLLSYYFVHSSDPVMSLCLDSRTTAVRRVCIVPVLKTVPGSRVEAAMPRLRRIGKSLYYYLPNLRDSYGKRDKARRLRSSSELLVLHGIKSVPDYEDSLTQAVEHAEADDSTVVVPSR
jgi:hypothetical protein